MTKPSRPLPVKALLVWLTIVQLMILFMVVIGGVTRLTDSGLSITEWKPILGAVPPGSEAEWQEAFAKYQAHDQFKLRRSTMDMDEFKFIYFWEYFHRLWGRLIGLAVALPLLAFSLARLLDRRRFWQLIGALVFGGAQGGIGWFMVVSGLDDGETYVSHIRLALHLLAAFGIFVYITWIILGLRPPVQCHTDPWRIKLRRATGILLALFVIQITYGAFVAGMRAGAMYPSFPLMGGKLIPDNMAHLEPWISNVLNNPTTVQFIHRLLGTLLVIATLGLWASSRKMALPDRPRVLLHTTLVLLLIQYVLGIATVLTKVSIVIAVTHQVTACLLLATLYALHYRLKPCETPAGPV